MNSLSREYYEQLEARLVKVVPRVRCLASDADADWFEEFIRAGEYGLAVETAAGVLDASMPGEPLRALSSRLLAEARLMQLDSELLQKLEELSGCRGGGFLDE